MHNRGTVDCTGLQYEGWLIQEARKRNPAIKTYGLSWVRRSERNLTGETEILSLCFCAGCPGLDRQWKLLL